MAGRPKPAHELSDHELRTRSGWLPHEIRHFRNPGAVAGVRPARAAEARMFKEGMSLKVWAQNGDHVGKP